MSIASSETLRGKKCLPCEGGVPVIAAEAAASFLQAIPKWSLSVDAKSISRSLQCRNFVEAVQWINRIAELAEDEQHHPDLHLTGYRKLRIDLTTHAIGGLSENDFILAAKVDAIVDQPS
jgi:4a-hydroxytetrahydrobiopterin dehydratase